MKKKIGLILSTVLIMSILVSLLVACSDDMNNANIDIGRDNADVGNNDSNNNNDNIPDSPSNDNTNDNQECVSHSLDENCVCTNCRLTSHTVSEWIVDKQATCTEEGTRHKECTVCEITIEEGSISTIDHDLDSNCICTNCNQTLHELNEDCICTVCETTAHAVNGLCRHGDYVYFGSYPQTIKANDVTITSTTNDKGYYLGSDNEWYVKVTASPNDSSYTFSTGTNVTDGTVYYFKVEPIRWRILTESNGKAFILCDSIIDNHKYDDSSNNYADSEIREWLNETFYNTAFSTLQKELILTTTVDNSVASAGYSSNQYACENTNDEVFLLSYAEVTNSSYGFSSSYSDYDEAKQMTTSDYSRATGVYMSTRSSYYATGWWWLRSPSYNFSDRARSVIRGSFVINDHGVFDASLGVVPALYIQLAQ